MQTLSQRTHMEGGRIRGRSGAFTIAEVIIAMGIMGIVTVMVLAGIGSGLFTSQLARENSRATQIMLEKIETIRLYTWDQLNTPGFIPTNFTVAYDPHSSGGLTYTGKLTISPASMASSYSSHIKKITVEVTWQTGDLTRERRMSTYFSRYGIQDYIY